MPPTLSPPDKHIWVHSRTLNLPDSHSPKADTKFMKNNPNVSFESRGEKIISNTRSTAGKDLNTSCKPGQAKACSKSSSLWSCKQCLPLVLRFQPQAKVWFHQSSLRGNNESNRLTSRAVGEGFQMGADVAATLEGLDPWGMMASLKKLSPHPSPAICSWSPPKTMAGLYTRGWEGWLDT